MDASVLVVDEAGAAVFLLGSGLESLWISHWTSISVPDLSPRVSARSSTSADFFSVPFDAAFVVARLVSCCSVAVAEVGVTVLVPSLATLTVVELLAAALDSSTTTFGRLLSCSEFSSALRLWRGIVLLVGGTAPDWAGDGLSLPACCSWRG